MYLSHLSPFSTLETLSVGHFISHSVGCSDALTKDVNPLSKYGSTYEALLFLDAIPPTAEWTETDPNIKIISLQAAQDFMEEIESETGYETRDPRTDSNAELWIPIVQGKYGDKKKLEEYLKMNKRIFHLITVDESLPMLKHPLSNGRDTTRLPSMRGFGGY